MEEYVNRVIRNLLSALILFFVGFFGFIHANDDEIKIITFKKIGEITEGFTEGEENYFWHIDDLCCDDENDLYVADAGWNKIFKFNAKGKFVLSFGRKGQGPGEFNSAPLSSPLRITFGNDGNIYITDPGNNRLSIYNKNGEFQKSFSLPQRCRDKAQTNKDGDIYLISNSGENVINCYDKNFKLKHSFLNVDKHFKYPILKPRPPHPSPVTTKDRPRPISNYQFRKVMMKNNHLIALSNLSLTVFHFDEENELVNEFMIKNEIFFKNFKERLESANTRGGFVNPFNMFLDSNENLCLMYYNSSTPNKWEVYRYNIDGTLIDLIRLPERVNSDVCADGLSNFYFIAPEDNEIGIYRIEKE